MFKLMKSLIKNCAYNKVLDLGPISVSWFNPKWWKQLAEREREIAKSQR